LPNFVSGWGRTVGGGNASDVLQQAMLPIADHLTCRIRNKNLTRVFEKQMLCAGGEGKGGCHVRRMDSLHLSVQAISSWNEKNEICLSAGLSGGLLPAVCLSVLLYICLSVCFSLCICVCDCPSVFQCIVSNMPRKKHKLNKSLQSTNVFCHNKKIVL